MTTDTDRMEALVHSAMAQADRTRRWIIVALVFVGLIEGCGIIGFALLADWSDRLHILLGLCTLMIYATLGLGMVALGAYVRECSLRVISAAAPN